MRLEVVLEGGYESKRGILCVHPLLSLMFSFTSTLNTWYDSAVFTP